MAKQPWRPSRLAFGVKNIRRSVKAGEGHGPKLFRSMPFIRTCAD